MRRLRSESGIAVPTAVWVVVILMGLALAASAVAITGQSQANRDRQVKRALGAADAGAEVAIWRMNQALVSHEISGLLGMEGLTTNTLRELGCLNASLDGVTLIGSGEWCSAVGGTDDELGDGAKYTYFVSSDLNIPIASLPSNLADTLVNGTTDIIARSVVSQGESNGVRRRVKALAILDVRLSDGQALDLFQQVRWVECPGTPSGSAPDSGCPSLGV